MLLTNIFTLVKKQFLIYDISYDTRGVWHCFPFVNTAVSIQHKSQQIVMCARFLKGSYMHSCWMTLTKDLACLPSANNMAKIFLSSEFLEECLHITYCSWFQFSFLTKVLGTETQNLQIVTSKASNHVFKFYLLNFIY